MLAGKQLLVSIEYPGSKENHDLAVIIQTKKYPATRTGYYLLKAWQ
jgi:hypothetical protein